MTVVIEAPLRPRDVLSVSTVLVLRNPVSILMMAAGPLLYLAGIAAGAEVLVRLGTTMSALVLLVPAFALLAGLYAAFRPGTAQLYEPAHWEFSDDGVDVEQAQRRARAEWTEFSGWRAVAGRRLLHTSARHYVVLPVGQLSDAQRAGLDELLLRRLGARRR